MTDFIRTTFPDLVKSPSTPGGNTLPHSIFDIGESVIPAAPYHGWDQVLPRSQGDLHSENRGELLLVLLANNPAKVSL